MAHQELHEAPSRRYVRAYLALWAVPAVGALGYLMTLAWQPEQLAPAPARPTMAEPDPGLRAATQALADIGSVRQTVDNLQKDLGDIKETVEQRGDQDKAVQSRLAALEEKVASLPNTAAVSTNTPATSKLKTAEKAQQQKAAPVKGGPPLKPGAPRVINVTEEPAVTTPANASKTPAEKAAVDKAPVEKTPIERSPIETGSIKQPEIVFGEAVVTRAGDLYAVQLDTAPSIDVLRLRWSLLVERYGATLASLQPRFVAPRTQGAPYKLLAGPLTSAADAKGICGELRAHLPACSTTDFIGEPL